MDDLVRHSLDGAELLSTPGSIISVWELYNERTFGDFKARAEFVKTKYKHPHFNCASSDDTLLSLV